MAEFWKTIDASYFPILSGRDPKHTKKDVFAALPSIKQNPADFILECNKGFVDDSISRNSFKISENSSINKLNQENFILSLHIIRSLYGGFMKMAERKLKPCERCLMNFENLIKTKYEFAIGRSKRASRVEKCAKNESRQLAKCFSIFDIGLCDHCLRKLNGHMKVSEMNSKIASTDLALKTVQKRSSSLFKTMFTRINASKRIQITINVSLEAEILRNYLLNYLVELEQKLLIDNIYNVIGKSRNMIFVEFIRLKGVYAMDLKELKLWNRYREGSVFKIHKCSYKRYNPYYSFNV